MGQSDLSTGSESYPVTQPQNAKVAFSSAKKYLVIEKEYLGNTLNHDEFVKAIGKALKSGHEKLNLTDEKIPGCIRKAKYFFHRPFAPAKSRCLQSGNSALDNMDNSKGH